MSSLVDVFESGFSALQAETAVERATIDGHAPKIGASFTCARKEYADRVMGKEKTSLKQAIIMRKGNIAEQLFEDLLGGAGIEYERQGEYVGKGRFDFMFVHPDLLIDISKQDMSKLTPEAEEYISDLASNGKKYKLVELKSTNTIPSAPHDSWVRQVNLQIEIIAGDLGIDPDEISASVFAVELSFGRYDVYDITYDPGEAMLALDDAISLESALEDWVQFANGDKEHLEFGFFDVNRNISSLCSVCEHALQCFGAGTAVELPDDYAEVIEKTLELSELEKSVKTEKEDLKQFLLNLGKKKGKLGKYEVVLQGGNKKEEIDPDSYTDGELLELAKRDATLIRPSNKDIMKIAKNLSDSDKWIIEGHLREKTTPISMRIRKSKE